MSLWIGWETSSRTGTSERAGPPIDNPWQKHQGGGIIHL